MTGVLCLLLAVFMGLFAGVADAGEEQVMAMRGNPPVGVKPQNMIHSMFWTGGVGDTQAHTPTVKVAPRVEEPGAVTPVARRSDGYIRWRDNCVRTPRLVAGQSLELDCTVGFGLTPRFVEMRDDEPEGFFESLLKELVSG